MTEQGELELFAKNAGRYVIKYNTAKNAIDAEMLADALTSYKSTIMAFVGYSSDCEEFRVEVETVESGCIEIHTILTAIQSVVNPETLPALIDGVKQLVELYKFLKGEPAKKVAPAENRTNEFNVTNSNNVTINVSQSVYNVYANNDNPPFGDAAGLTKNGVSSVQFLDETGKEKITIDRRDYGSFSKYRHKFTEEELNDQDEIVELVVETIPIGSPQRKQWGFVNGCESIKAKIEDSEFLQRIEKHQVTFGKGDRIKAMIRTHKEYDSSLNCAVVKSRKILKVYGVDEIAK